MIVAQYPVGGMKLLLAIAVFAFISGAVSGDAVAGPNDLVMVVNDSNSTSNLSNDEVRSIYLGSKKYWQGQNQITPLNRAPDQASGESFFGKVLKMPHSKYSLHWRKRALAGKGVEPKVLTDASAVLRQISGDKGAVGYVLQSEYDAHGGSGVKIVLTVP